MKDSLATLSRIEKFNINEQRKELVALQEQQEAFRLQLEKLNIEFEQEKEFHRQNELVGDFGAYVKKYLETKDKLLSLIAELDTQIEIIRDRITEMFKEQKTFEIIDEERKKRLQHEEDLKIQKQLDEIGTNSYIKRQDESK